MLSMWKKLYVVQKQIINLVRDKDTSFFEARKRVATQSSYASSVSATSSSTGELSSVKSQIELRILREVNPQCIVRCAEIQGQLLSQVQENKQLKDLTESQRSHIEFLQKISLSDPDLQFHPVPSPGFDLISPPLVSFSKVSGVCFLSSGICVVSSASYTGFNYPPFSTASVLVLQESFLKVSSSVTLRNKKKFRAERSGSPGGGLVTTVSNGLPGHLLSFSLPHSEVEVLGVRLWIGPNSNSPVTVVNVYSPRDLFSHCQLEVSLDQYDSDHCPILVSLSGFGVHTIRTRNYINWRQFSTKINDNLDKSVEIKSIEAIKQEFHSCSVSSSYSFSSSSRKHSQRWDAHCNYLKALKRRLLRRAKSYPVP
ncbi:hypothetical protein AVEN_191603-1 [Araneus ventricosus]|uniref:Endonuclease/exonuclease/phosphatase domain-containing protein n=1 Tax=Araneus ventricosus TaxID=182803 RepID=A0A4Y2WPD9_ARAVE|nr:hypothetical protein AVEN_191603-1 [Araneus ventricosus]